VISCLLASIIFSLFIANQKFNDYIHQKEIEKLVYLTDALAVYYSENGGWDSLFENTTLWVSLLKNGWLELDPANGEKVQTSIDKDPAIIAINQKVNQPVWDPLDLGARICLFDKDKKFVISTKTFIRNFYQEEFITEGCTYLPIKVEGNTAGWLGLVNNQEPTQPLDQMFRHTQSMIFYMLGGLFLVILVFIGITYSKYILRPITRLASATKKVGSLNFNTRIPVESTDEIGELAENFNDMAKKLEHYEQNQKQWLMDISHELRTPLSVLLCEIDALKDGIRKPTQTLLVSLSDEIRHLVKLVNDISDISLIETGIFTVKKKLVKPIPILSHEAYIFKERFESNDMSIEFELEPEATDLKIFSDSNRLMQLFSNIFENAIHYTKKPGRLVIRQNYTENYIRFVFEDSGPGIPDEALPLIFNRLYRADSSRSRKTGGNGLGLAICKSIVERHNGKILARNVEGGGLAIEILLPIVNDPGDSTTEQLYLEKEGNVI